MPKPMDCRPFRAATRVGRAPWRMSVRRRAGHRRHQRIAGMARTSRPDRAGRSGELKATRTKDSDTLINNRQNGRRRGRGGAQVRGPNNGSDRGNRIDNRARGNAAQLHEKYKNLARDAQTQGDRVMTEYYLQFADHYFRVLNENRARFEEHNQQRRQRFDNEDFEGASEEAEVEAAEDAVEVEAREPRREYREQRDRRERPPREPQPVEAEASVEPQPVAEEAEDGRGRRRGRRPRREIEAEVANGEAAQIEADRLPPAFAPVTEGSEGPASEANGHGAEEAAPRRRRTRKAAAAPAEDNVAA